MKNEMAKITDLVYLAHGTVMEREERLRRRRGLYCARRNRENAEESCFFSCNNSEESLYTLNFLPLQNGNEALGRRILPALSSYHWLQNA